MFRFFDDKQERRHSTTTSSSWLDTLTTAAGWLNPFNLCRKNLRDVYLTSLTLLSVVPQAMAREGEWIPCDPSGAVCIHDQFGGAGTLRHHKFLSGFYIERAMFDPIQDLLSKHCNVSYAQPFCCVMGTFNHTLSIGQGMIGVRFELDYNTIDQCVINALKQYAPDSFGTIQDISLTLGVSAALLIGGGIGFCLWRRHQPQAIQVANNPPALPQPLAPQDAQVDIPSTQPLLGNR